MQYQAETLDVRLKNHITNYDFHSLYEPEKVCSIAKNLCEAICLSMQITDRKGNVILECGDAKEQSDMSLYSDRKVKVCGRTMLHIYVKSEKSVIGSDYAKKLVEDLANSLEELGAERYFHKEAGSYLDEYYKSATIHSDKEDALTGVMSQSYFEHRMQIIDRSEVVPVAAIVVNINDWKFANDHFGDEESDRLIALVADILKEKAKPEYLIGRVDGDVFYIVIPMPEQMEAENYCKAVMKECDMFEDDHLAPSVACGIAYKTNVEHSVESVFSEAEVEMLENKISIKNAEGYCKRLKKGI